VGATNVAELELRYLHTPSVQRDSYRYVTVYSFGTENLNQGHPVAQIVTGAYSGRWQVRARSSMKSVPGPWGFPVQFQLFQTQPVQSQQQTSPPMVQQAPLPGSSVMQAPAPSSSAPTQMKRSSSLITRGVDKKGGSDSIQTVDQPAETEKKP